MELKKRAEWGARPPDYINTAVMSAQSTGHWNGPTITVGGKTTWDHSKCDGLVRGIQNFHMDAKDWSDIAYNFVICPHGVIYEGRGLDVINGANGTNSGNRSSHAIMWLAGEANRGTAEERKAFRDCVHYISEMTTAPDSAMGHRDHKSTECPGDSRYAWIHQSMPVDNPPLPPLPLVEEEEETMNEPLEIVRGDNSPHWFVTDGITKQWINRPLAGILCLNRGALIRVKPADMSDAELSKMDAHIWPQAAVDRIRLVGPTPPLV